MGRTLCYTLWNSKTLYSHCVINTVSLIEFHIQTSVIAFLFICRFFYVVGLCNDFGFVQTGRPELMRVGDRKLDESERFTLVDPYGMAPENLYIFPSVVLHLKILHYLWKNSMAMSHPLFQCFGLLSQNNAACILFQTSSCGWNSCQQ